MVRVYSMSVISLSNKEKTKQIYETFKKYIPDELKTIKKYQYNEKNNKIFIPIPRNIEAFSQLEKIARENHISAYKFEFTDYTEDEMKNAKFFQMLISDPLQSEGTYARDYGTKYIYCCDVCKTGGVLASDVFVDRKFVKKCDIATLRPDIFVSYKIKELIEENGLTGVSFEHRVIDYIGRELPEYYVMSFDNVMPPMDSKTWFSFEPPAKSCIKCSKKIPYLKSHCYYKQVDFEDAKDFNLSYEAYDNFSERAIIVSKKVKEVFDKAKVRCGFQMLNVIL